MLENQIQNVDLVGEDGIFAGIFEGNDAGWRVGKLK